MMVRKANRVHYSQEEMGEILKQHGVVDPNDREHLLTVIGTLPFFSLKQLAAAISIIAKGVKL